MGSNENVLVTYIFESSILFITNRDNKISYTWCPWRGLSDIPWEPKTPCTNHLTKISCSKLVQRMRDYINENFSHSLSLKDICWTFTTISCKFNVITVIHTTYNLPKGFQYLFWLLYWILNTEDPFGSQGRRHDKGEVNRTFYYKRFRN